MRSGFILFNQLNLTGSVGRDISWNEYAKKRTGDYHDSLYNQMPINEKDSSIFHMGDTTIKFPDITYSARLNRFLPIWKYVPVLGPASKRADISHNGNFARTQTRPFDSFRFGSKFGFTSTLKWKTRKDWEWVFMDKRDWSRDYELLPAPNSDYTYTWEDSLGFRKLIGAKKAFKLLRWTFQFDNQLEVFGGVKYGPTKQWKPIFLYVDFVHDKGKMDSIWRSMGAEDIRDLVEDYGDAKDMFELKKDKPTNERSTLTLSSGFAYNFSKNIKGGGHLWYKREFEKKIPSNTIDVEVFVVINL
jgi:hypothetical protein